jgi:scyllo-inositol 2-dehydrogenase (NADP+)
LDPQEDALKIGKSPNESNWGMETKENWGFINTEFQGKQISEKVETIAGNYQAFYDNLYDSVLLGKELAVKPEEALNVIRVIEAALQSNKEGRRINL